MKHLKEWIELYIVIIGGVIMLTAVALGILNIFNMPLLITGFLILLLGVFVAIIEN